MSSPLVSPLQLNQLSRDLWANFDPSMIAQLAPLANDECFAQRFYKAPADQDEVVAANGYVTYGLRITPGSIIYGFYLPCIPVPGNITTSVPPAFTVQITDVSLKHKWYDAPVSSLFLANYKPTYQAALPVQAGSFPNLLPAPYPVVGSGLLKVEIQSTSNSPQRIQLVFGVLGVC